MECEPTTDYAWILTAAGTDPRRLAELALLLAEAGIGLAMMKQKDPTLPRVEIRIQHLRKCMFEVESRIPRGATVNMLNGGAVT